MERDKSPYITWTTLHTGDCGGFRRSHARCNRNCLKSSHIGLRVVFVYTEDVEIKKS